MKENPLFKIFPGSTFRFSLDQREHLRTTLTKCNYEKEGIEEFINALEWHCDFFKSVRTKGSNDKLNLEKWIKRCKRTVNFLQDIGYGSFKEIRKKGERARVLPNFGRRELRELYVDRFPWEVIVSVDAQIAIEKMETLIKSLEKGKKAFRPGPTKGYKDVLVRQIGLEFLRNFERPKPYKGAFAEIVDIALDAVEKSGKRQEHRRIISEALKESPFRKLS